MKILILSDIHANLAALEAVRDEVKGNIDYIWCLGDTVNYGPQPRECLEVVRGIAHKVIRGNHDNAVGLDRDCGCSVRYQALAQACKKFTQASLNSVDKGFLSSPPLVEEVAVGTSASGRYGYPESSSGPGALPPGLDRYKFTLSHGSPKGDMYKYLSPELPDDSFLAELEGLEADFVFLGHTHIPMIKRFSKTILVNPGSVGQPRDGIPQASYALWEDGKVEIKRIDYDLEATIKALRETGLRRTEVDALSSILRKGGL